jgi:integrase/recombinase XerD
VRATLACAIEAFYQDRRAAGFAPRTLEGYRTQLTRLRTFLEERRIERVAEVTAQDLVAYQSWILVARGASGAPRGASAQLHDLTTVKSLFRFLARTGVILMDPAQHLELPRVRPRGLVRILDEAGVERLLAAPDETTVIGIRDRAMLEVLYSTGIRASELIGLDTFDIDRVGGELTVRQGKGQKARRIPVGRVACDGVGRYLESSRPGLVRRASETALFVSQWGRRLDRANVARLVRTYASQAGLSGRVTTHALRHAFATHLLKGGASLRHVQEMLGHARVSTTQLYTHLDISDLKAVHRRCHPRARAKDAGSGSSVP